MPHNDSGSESDLLCLITDPFVGKNRLVEKFALFRAHNKLCLEAVQELLVPMKKKLNEKPARLGELGVFADQGGHLYTVVVAVVAPF